MADMLEKRLGQGPFCMFIVEKFATGIVSFDIFYPSNVANGKPDIILICLGPNIPGHIISQLRSHAPHFLHCGKHCHVVRPDKDMMSL